MNNFTFKAKISENHSDALHHLFYFNGNQAKYAKKIIQSVHAFGQPAFVIDESGMISLELESKNRGQSLFMFSGTDEDRLLIGAMLYSLIILETIVIVHLVIHEKASDFFQKEPGSATHIFIQHLTDLMKKLNMLKK